MMEKIKLEEPAIVVPVKDPKVITDSQAVASPNTTAEQDRHSAGQRSINRTWEITQSIIALSFILASEIVIIYVVVYVSELQVTAFNFLCTIVGTVIGFYFGRTNHQRVGGVDLGR